MLLSTTPQEAQRSFLFLRLGLQPLCIYVALLDIAAGGYDAASNHIVTVRLPKQLQQPIIRTIKELHLPRPAHTRHLRTDISHERVRRRVLRHTRADLEALQRWDKRGKTGVEGCPG